jgi:hypothetical protein
VNVAKGFTELYKFEFQNSWRCFKLEKVGEHLILLQNFVDQRFLAQFGIKLKN